MLSAVLLFVSGIVPNVFADWYDDISSGRYVDIDGNNCVVDTFYGVDALYNETGSTYYCNELVIRFYKEAYGLSISAGTSGISMKTEGYKFVTPETPKAGDVVYVSAAMRGTSDHWAIVKSYSGGYLTLFEQNVESGGQAIVDRKLKYPSDSYHLYTPVSTGEKPAPTLGGSKSEETTKESTTATTTTTTKATTTTTTKPTTTTTKPTTTTTKPTTTRATTTTTKPTTTKATTTRPTTTKVTATIPSTTVQSTTATLPSTSATTQPLITFLQIEVTENYWQYTTTEPTTADETQEMPTASIALGAVCAVLAVGVAFLIFMLIKKK